EPLYFPLVWHSAQRALMTGTISWAKSIFLGGSAWAGAVSPTPAVQTANQTHHQDWGRPHCKPLANMMPSPEPSHQFPAGRLSPLNKPSLAFQGKGLLLTSGPNGHF